MILDVHVHGPGVGTLNVITAKDMLEKMDANGLEVIITHPILWGVSARTNI